MRISFALVFLLTQAASTCFCAMGPEDLESKLRGEVANYSVSSENFVNALTKVAGKFQIPMGIEWIRNQAALKKVDMTWKRVTLRRVVESLVYSQPGYEFEIRNGVLQVFPQSSFRDRGSFLNLKIDEFKVQKEFVGIANRRLRDMVKRAISPPRCVPGGGGIGFSAAIGAGDQRVTFQLQGATVRDILDKLVSSDGFRVWIVTLCEDSTLTPTGFRRSTSPGGRDISDEEQPVWQLLAWGQLPYL